MLRKSRKWKKHLHAWTSAVIKRGKKGLIFLLSPLLHNNLFPFKNYTNNVLGFWLNPLWFYESLDVWSDVLLNYSCFQLGSKIQLWSFNSFVFYCIFKLNSTKWIIISADSLNLFHSFILDFCNTHFHLSVLPFIGL